MLRAPILLLLLTAAALAFAACGSSKDDNSSGKSSEDKAYDGELKFASCMRKHGVDIADPQRTADGGIMMKAGKAKGSKGAESSTTLGPDSPKFKAAEKDCDKYHVDGGGRAPSPAEQARQQDAMIAYARCMRSKGIPFADPEFSGNRVKMRLSSGARPDSPKFKAADEACHPLMAAGDPKLGAGGGATSSGGPAQ